MSITMSSTDGITYEQAQDVGQSRRLRKVYAQTRLAPGEDLKLIARIRQSADGSVDKNAAMTRLIEGVEQYVWKKARKLATNRGVEVEDLVQHGLDGVLRAVETFDENRGYTFLTYADDWINQRMMRAIEREGSTNRYGTRIPCHQFGANGKVQKVIDPLRDRLGREPTPYEVAVEAKLKTHDKRPNVPQAERAMDLMKRSLVSLDAQRGASDDSEVSIADAIADPNAIDPQNAALSADHAQVVQRVFSQLNPEARTVMSMRLGMGVDGREYSQDEVCAELGIKKSRLLRIQKDAKAELRASDELREISGMFG